MTIRAIVHEEDGAFWAEVPELPGCVTQGDTMEEIERNLEEAVTGYLTALRNRTAQPLRFELAHA